MLVLAGNKKSANPDGHYFKTGDGQEGLWLGSVEDIWKMDSPHGEGDAFIGGVQVGSISDAFLFGGYEKKELVITSNVYATVEIQLDYGDELDWAWRKYMTVNVSPTQPYTYEFPEGLSAPFFLASFGGPNA